MRGAEYMREGAEWLTHKLVGQNYTPPDLVAKVTGRAKYAEDFRADGMLFCKLLLSPMPHARVRSIDTSAALAMPGVKAILTADDLPRLCRTARENARSTNEPLYAGRADPGRRRRRRAHRGRSDRAHPRRSRAAAVRRRSARQPAARRPQRATEGNVWGPPPA